MGSANLFERNRRWILKTRGGRSGHQSLTSLTLIREVLSPDAPSASTIMLLKAHTHPGPENRAITTEVPAM